MRSRIAFAEDSNALKLFWVGKKRSQRAGLRFRQFRFLRRTVRCEQGKRKEEANRRIGRNEKDEFNCRVATCICAQGFMQMTIS